MANIPLSPLSPVADWQVVPIPPPTAPLPVSISNSRMYIPAPFSTEVVEARRKLRVLILSSDTGGGHRASAQALLAALYRLYPGQIQGDIVDFWVEVAQGPFSKFPQQYSLMAKHPWSWKLTYEMTRFPPCRFVTEALFHSFGYGNIRDAFLKYAPDLIVSVHPLVNTVSMKVLKEMEHVTGVPRVPYVTVVTDLGGAHPTWFHKGVDMTYIPSEGVEKVANKVGVSKLRMLGLPVREDFWTECEEKDVLRERLGMTKEGYAVLVVGGGDGVGGLKGVVKGLDEGLAGRFECGVQIVVVCGRNEKLKGELAERDWKCEVKALGYVSNMSEWMGACDIICTKAGPGTIAEALIRGLPIVITGYLPGQEEANVRFVTDEGVGVYAKTPKEIARVVREWLSRDIGSMGEKAKMLGRPGASVEIARDLVRVAKEKIEENVVVMHRRRMLRGRKAIREGQSHLAFRLQFLLRVVVATMLAKRVVCRSPPGSPA